MRQARIYYLGMVCTSAYVEATGVQAMIGAGANKMAAVVSALRLVGERALLVSLPFLESGSLSQHGRLCRSDGFPAFFLRTWRPPVLRKVLGSLAFAWFVVRRVKTVDTVLLYNHAIEYSFALLILRIRGVDVFYDIEDLPLTGDRGLRGLLIRLGFLLTLHLTSDKKITASTQLGRTLNLREFFPIHGIAADPFSTDGSRKWKELDSGAPLRVHYGGTLIRSTGLELFCDALTRLDALFSSLGRQIEFIVTGLGDFERILTKSKSLQFGSVRVEIHQSVMRDEYLGLLDSCHASLSLRDPGAEYSSATFPSKVIEITSHGLSLVSSRVSDIDEIFNEDTAWLLPEFSAPALANILSDMSLRPAEVRRRAFAGQDMARARFEPSAVGCALAKFLGHRSKGSSQR